MRSATDIAPDDPLTNSALPACRTEKRAERSEEATMRTQTAKPGLALLISLATTFACHGEGIQGEATGRATASTVEPPRSVDRSFAVDISDPTFPLGEGPSVIIDEAHNNFHAMDGTYRPFAELLKQDGYVMLRGGQSLDRALLDSCRIFVISDAQPPRRVDAPPTFSPAEIDILNAWVRQGGSLFLITDHMPDPAAIAGLARSFGIEVNNGYVLNGFLEGNERPLVFDRSSGTLVDSPITNGRHRGERVDRVATFAGSAFQADERFQPLMVFGPGRRSWMPSEYWKFPPGTPSLDVTGWYQGGVMEFGEGKVAFFSEAAMFTAQVFADGKVKAGMNHPLAADNARLLLNVMRWLSD